MKDHPVEDVPAALAEIEAATARIGFTMASERRTGSLLRSLAATKPGGSFLELGTGTGLSTCWILDGMNSTSRLLSVDKDEGVLAVARQVLGKDPRVTFVCADGAELLSTCADQRYDFIFADTWPGKFTHLDAALQRLAPGGLYIIDDLLPQQSWPEGHAPKVPQLIAVLERRPELVMTRLNWATGLVVAVKRAEQGH